MGGRKKWRWSLQSPGSRADGAELVYTLSPTSWSDKRQALCGGDRRWDEDPVMDFMKAQSLSTATHTDLITVFALSHTNNEHN